MLFNNTIQNNLKDHFPLSNQKGRDRTTINLSLIRQQALKKQPLPSNHISKLISEHHKFLRSGGAGGKWKTILLKGLVFGIYDGVEARAGNQANFEYAHILSDCIFDNLALPFSNWCGAFAENFNASGIELSHFKIEIM